MAHNVTCIYCKHIFDRDKHPFRQVSARRYAHEDCAVREEANRAQEEKDKEAFEKYILTLFKLDVLNVRIRKQIKTYIEEYGYTYSGMLKALIYWFEIKGHSIEKANGGIGIIPYVYQQAYEYYYSLWQANQKNEFKNIEEYIPKVRVIKIPIPQKKDRRKKLFTFLDEEVSENAE